VKAYQTEIVYLYATPKTSSNFIRRYIGVNFSNLNFLYI